jgi:hypothetical protein
MINKYIQIFLGTLIIIPLLNADVYFEPTKTKFEHVVGLIDQDKVVSDDTGGFTKFFDAMKIVPLRISLPIIIRQCATIVGALCSSRGDKQPIKGIGTNIDRMIEKEPALKQYREVLMWKLNNAWPRLDMITYLQSMQRSGVKLVSATNNDVESLLIKMEKLNHRMVEKNLVPLRFDAYFCAGSSSGIANNKASDGRPAQAVIGGKDTDEYFEKIFTFAEKQYGCNRADTLFIFVDDLEKNITRARNVAKRENVTLCAVLRNKPDNIIVAEMQQALSTYLPHIALHNI